MWFEKSERHEIEFAMAMPKPGASRKPAWRLDLREALECRWCRDRAKLFRSMQFLHGESATQSNVNSGSTDQEITDPRKMAEI